MLVWLGAGEILMRVTEMPIPAPVIGLVLLYADLLYHKRLPDELGALADRVLSFLGMLFVPAGVGVIAYSDVRWCPLLRPLSAERWSPSSLLLLPPHP
ncbi:CidA/LrgA family protein [Methylobacterium nigriterrae]|uniref:CidA/LrgA family protein n=1 Tax=Methylobacterium nigriterrae TaxID=3127512 RepID=UPI00301362A4